MNRFGLFYNVRLRTKPKNDDSILIRPLKLSHFDSLEAGPILKPILNYKNDDSGGAFKMNYLGFRITAVFIRIVIVSNRINTTAPFR